MCSCIARILKVYNLSVTNFVNIQRNWLKSVDVKLPAPSEIKSVSRLTIIIMKTVMGVIVYELM